MSDAAPLESVAIIGGGTAGWMTALALARFLDTRRCSLRLVESDAIGTVGVGEATIPALHDFHRRMGIEEAGFMEATGGTYKLGIEFVDWLRQGHRYMHPFGTFGQNIDGVGFHHYWLRHRDRPGTGAFDDYTLPYSCAKLGRFRHPLDDPRSVYSTYSYAFHFDAAAYGRFLRERAESLGVERIEGLVEEVLPLTSEGGIAAVRLANGRTIEADFFVDCTGFRSLLLGAALGVPYESWRQWLPCNRAVAAASTPLDEPPPFTRATAREAGWQWRIPLRHRTGNGHVYSADHIGDDDAARVLSENLDGDRSGEPRVLRFEPGRRARMWQHNCVAIGLAAGFLEPLESTSIHLIQAAILKLVEFFPDRGFADPDIAQFNREMNLAFDEIRDFLILHYKATERDDSEFWNYCRTMEVPDSLAERVELFRERGVAAHRRGELFIETNWLAVYLGQGVFPFAWDPRADRLDDETLTARLTLMREYLEGAADALPGHAEALRGQDAPAP